jgi:hypothetical protein
MISPMNGAFAWAVRVAVFGLALMLHLWGLHLALAGLLGAAVMGWQFSGEGPYVQGVAVGLWATIVVLCAVSGLHYVTYLTLVMIIAEVVFFVRKEDSLGA